MSVEQRWTVVRHRASLDKTFRRYFSLLKFTVCLPQRFAPLQVVSGPLHCFSLLRAWQRSPSTFPSSLPRWSVLGLPFRAKFIFLFLCFGFWPHCRAYGAIVPQPGIEPAAPAVKAWSLNQWTARGILRLKQSLFYESSLFKGWHLFFSIWFDLAPFLSTY